jgi:hypothetical protein
LFLFIVYIIGLFIVFYYNISIECLTLIALIMTIIVILLNYLYNKLNNIENNKKEGE